MKLKATSALTGSVTIDFRAEVFKLTNTPPLNAPNAVAGAAGFGSITSAGDPRVLQIALTKAQLLTCF